MLNCLKDRISWLVVAAVAAFLFGCASAPDEKISSLKIDSHNVSSLHSQETSRVNVDPSDYLLGSGDLLQVTVFESEDLNAKVRVSSQVQTRGMFNRSSRQAPMERQTSLGTVDRALHGA